MLVNEWSSGIGLLLCLCVSYICVYTHLFLLYTTSPCILVHVQSTAVCLIEAVDRRVVLMTSRASYIVHFAAMLVWFRTNVDMLENSQRTKRRSEAAPSSAGFLEAILGYFGVGLKSASYSSFEKVGAR